MASLWFYVNSQAQKPQMRSENTICASSLLYLNKTLSSCEVIFVSRDIMVVFHLPTVLLGFLLHLLLILNRTEPQARSSNKYLQWLCVCRQRLEWGAERKVCTCYTRLHTSRGSPLKVKTNWNTSK